MRDKEGGNRRHGFRHGVSRLANTMKAKLSVCAVLLCVAGAAASAAEGTFKERMAKVNIYSQNWPLIEKNLKYTLEAPGTDAEKLKALLLLNMCLVKLNRPDLAGRALDEAFALNPSDPSDLPELADKLQYYCQYEKALVVIEKILANPGSTAEMREMAILSKAQAFDKQDNNEKAKELYTEILNSATMSRASKDKAREALDLMGKLITPKELWAGFDPDKGDFKEEIIKEETQNGIYSKESFISVYVNGEEVRVYCQYKVKAGTEKAPALLNVHGWLGCPSIKMNYVNDGWAVMSYDYCGPAGNRKLFTKYPEKLSYGMMDHTKPKIKDDLLADPKKSSFYLWYVIERRVLSYLERQKEVDKTRMGAVGYSVGGTMMWALGMDPRMKAVVAYFGIGWCDYYRDHGVWLYNNPYIEPPKTAREKVMLSCLVPESYVPYMTAATLWLNGSNDHHGGHERGLETFKRFKQGVPWSFAIQARAHHNTERIEQDTKMWLERHVLGKDVFWPAQPKSAIRLDAKGVPELVVTPENPERVKSVEIYYALKEPCSFGRPWRDAASVRNGDSWTGTMPVMNINDYVFGYANVQYDTTLVLSSFFNAAIPAKLGPAKATDQRSGVFGAGKDGMFWSDTCETEGVGGVKGFRAFDNRKGTGTANLSDPKWRAPAGAQLAFKFYCTEPQTLILTANDYSAEIDITASDDQWQTRIVPAGKLTRGANKEAMKEWSTVSTLGLAPRVGSDISKVIFTEFKWVEK